MTRRRIRRFAMSTELRASCCPHSTNVDFCKPCRVTVRDVLSASRRHTRNAIRLEFKTSMPDTYYRTSA